MSQKPRPTIPPALPPVVTRTNATDKGELAQVYRAAFMYREVAVASLQARWHSIKTKQVADAAYESPAWPYRQAAYNAQLQEIEHTLNHYFNVKVKHYGNE